MPLDNFQLRRQFYDDLLTNLVSGKLSKEEIEFIETLIEIVIFKKKFSDNDLTQLVSRDLFSELFTIQNALSMWENLPVVDENSVYLVFALWNDKVGPVPRDYFPRTKPPFDVSQITIQLFNAAWSFWDDRAVYPKGMMVEVETINRQAYLLFDGIYDVSARGNVRPLMFGVIAPHISYTNSLEIKDTLSKIAKQIKEWNFDHWDELGSPCMEGWWDHVTHILTTNAFHYFSR